MYFVSRLNGGFQGCVNGISGNDKAGRAAGNVQGLSAVVHEWQERLRQEEDGLEMDVSRRAMAFPIPREPPVIIAILRFIKELPVNVLAVMP